MDENIIILIFNRLFLFIAVKLAYSRSSNQKETACYYENWYFGVHSFFRCHLDIYPWSLFQSDSLFFLCFLFRNLVAIWSAVDTAGWDSLMKNWSRGVSKTYSSSPCTVVWKRGKGIQDGWSASNSGLLILIYIWKPQRKESDAKKVLSRVWDREAYSSSPCMSTYDLNFRVIHFFFFVSFSERLFHTKEI